MTKLNKTFFIVGLLLWAGGILLISFPAVMKYVFSIISVLSGTVFLVIAWNGKKSFKL